jgi:hypothetical protein
MLLFSHKTNGPDRLDRYQTVAGAHQDYDDEARKKLLDKINRIAANLGVDEVMHAAATEHLKKIGEIGEIVEDETDETERPLTDETGDPPVEASLAADAKKWFQSPVSP